MARVLASEGGPRPDLQRLRLENSHPRPIPITTAASDASASNNVIPRAQNILSPIETG